MSEAPVSLYDEYAVYNNYILKSVVPKLLKVIADSGLSYEDAKLVPDDLRKVIEMSCIGALKSTRFQFDESDYLVV